MSGAKRQRRGVVLLITMVVLVLLSILTYQVTARIASHRHRLHYQIDYTKARYACDSALKFALTHVQTLEFELISRPNEPDFSDVFGLSEEEYQLELERWNFERLSEEDPDAAVDDIDGNEIDANDDTEFANEGETDPNNSFGRPEVRGPYGPQWPLLVPPIVFQIDEAKVTIRIEDENAKYPLGWMLLDEPGIKNEIETGFENFFEWNGYSLMEVEELKKQLSHIQEIKPLKMAFKPITQTAKRTAPPATNARKPTKGRISSRKPATKTQRTTISAADQESRQKMDFSRLLNSSLLDRECMVRPTIESDTRQESSLKYIGLSGVRQVNINTAPRHVLEAAFTFGGQQTQVADNVIQKRRIEPITDLADLKKMAVGNADIDKCLNFLTTTSTAFTLRVTVKQGLATARSLAVVTRENNKIRIVSVMSD